MPPSNSASLRTLWIRLFFNLDRKCADTASTCYIYYVSWVVSGDILPQSIYYNSSWLPCPQIWSASTKYPVLGTHQILFLFFLSSFFFLYYWWQSKSYFIISVLKTILDVPFSLRIKSKLLIRLIPCIICLLISTTLNSVSFTITFFQINWVFFMISLHLFVWLLAILIWV